MSTVTAVAAPRSRRARRILARLAIGLAVLLVLAYLGVGALAANIMTTPRRNFAPGDTPATRGLTYQDVRFPARGGDVMIAGWYIPADGNRAVVIVHGIGGSRTMNFGGKANQVAEAFHQRGFAVLMIDMRGHGQSGDARFSFGLHERRDIMGAVDWLKGQRFEPGSIGVLGVSMGAAASIGAAADDPDIGALVEDSAYAEISPVIRQQWHDASGLPDAVLPGMLLMHRIMFGYDIAASRPVDEINKIAPRAVLIIHSTADRLVPIEQARQLKAAAPTAEFWEVSGATHASAYERDSRAYLAKVLGFFEAHLT